jgi:hypothetical protein
MRMMRSYGGCDKFCSILRCCNNVGVTIIVIVIVIVIDIDIVTMPKKASECGMHSLALASASVS